MSFESIRIFLRKVGCKGERSSEYFCFDVMNWMKRFVQLIVLVDESRERKNKTTISNESLLWWKSQPFSSRLETRIKECINKERKIVEKTRKEFRNESENWREKSRILLGILDRLKNFNFSIWVWDFYWYNPKDDDLNLNRMKPEEIQVEVRRTF